MAIVNQVQKRAVLSKSDVIKYQILTHCYLNKITVSDADLNCLTFLSLSGPIELTHFCYDASSDEQMIFKSPQTVRNAVNKAMKTMLVIKDDVDKKLIRLNPTLQVQTEGDILLDYKFLGR
jgi:hypothetical protein